MGNYLAAIEIYKELLAKQPNDRLKQNLLAANIAYGYNLYAKLDDGQAILYFEDAIQLNNKEASAFFGFAQANEKMGCLEKALENYKKAVSLAPGNREYNIALNDFRNAHGELISKTENTETKPEADIVSGTSENLEQPEQVIETKEAEKVSGAKEVSPVLSYDELVKKGDEAYKKQDYENAIDYYTKAVIFKPEDKVTMLKIANTYKLLGNNDKAVSFYNKLLVIEPNNADALFNKGIVLINQKKSDEAIKCFEKVIKSSPDYPYAYYLLGTIYEQNTDIEKALEYYYLYAGIEKDEKMLSTVNQKIKQLEKE